MLSFLKTTTTKSTFSLMRMFSQSKDPLFERVENVIEQRVRPALRMDGGDIKLDKIENGVVDVTLLGHCSTCPSRKATLHDGILYCLKEEIPEIKDVRETLVDMNY